MDEGAEGAEGADSIGNLHFVACNANVSLAGMRVPSVRMVSVLFSRSVVEA
jgi:tRNA (guanine-N7-)-methyltransferase